jgi:hypothetical protein
MRTFLYAGLVVLGLAALAPAAAMAAGPFQYHAITPCRVADTRGPNGVNGGPILFGNNPTPRNFQVQGVCGVPVGADAATLNVTIASPSSGGFLTLWPSGGAQPVVSTINFTTADSALANGAIIPLSTNTLDLSVFFGGSGTVHLILDVTGYFDTN